MDRHAPSIRKNLPGPAKPCYNKEKPQPVFFYRSGGFSQTGGKTVDVRIGDTVILKKPHPCGGNRFLVLRTGVDFKLRCLQCGHEIMAPRVKIEKSIRAVEHAEP